MTKKYLRPEFFSTLKNSFIKNLVSYGLVVRTLFLNVFYISNLHAVAKDVNKQLSPRGQRVAATSDAISPKRVNSFTGNAMNTLQTEEPHIML